MRARLRIVTSELFWVVEVMVDPAPPTFTPSRPLDGAQVLTFFTDCKLQLSPAAADAANMMFDSMDIADQPNLAGGARLVHMPSLLESPAPGQEILGGWCRRTEQAEWVVLEVGVPLRGEGCRRRHALQVPWFYRIGLTRCALPCFHFTTFGSSSLVSTAG
jgi:hypothetical protein